MISECRFFIATIATRIAIAVYYVLFGGDFLSAHVITFSAVGKLTDLLLAAYVVSILLSKCSIEIVGQFSLLELSCRTFFADHVLFSAQ